MIYTYASYSFYLQYTRKIQSQSLPETNPKSCKNTSFIRAKLVIHLFDSVQLIY